MGTFYPEPPSNLMVKTHGFPVTIFPTINQSIGEVLSRAAYPGDHHPMVSCIWWRWFFWSFIPWNILTSFNKYSIYIYVESYYSNNFYWLLMFSANIFRLFGLSKSRCTRTVRGFWLLFWELPQRVLRGDMRCDRGAKPRDNHISGYNYTILYI